MRGTRKTRRRTGGDSNLNFSIILRVDKTSSDENPSKCLPSLSTVQGSDLQQSQPMKPMSAERRIKRGGRAYSCQGRETFSGPFAMRSKNLLFVSSTVRRLTAGTPVQEVCCSLCCLAYVKVLPRRVTSSTVPGVLQLGHIALASDFHTSGISMRNDTTACGCWQDTELHDNWGRESATLGDWNALPFAVNGTEKNPTTKTRLSIFLLRVQVLCFLAATLYVCQMFHVTVLGLWSSSQMAFSLCLHFWLYYIPVDC